MENWRDTDSFKLGQEADDIGVTNWGPSVSPRTVIWRKKYPSNLPAREPFLTGSSKYCTGVVSVLAGVKGAVTTLGEDAPPVVDHHGVPDGGIVEQPRYEFGGVPVPCRGVPLPVRPHNLWLVCVHLQGEKVVVRVAQRFCEYYG